MSIVLDSSAMIAYLRDETGADLVENLLSDADVPAFAHSVNLCEVHYDFLLRNNHVVAREALRDLMMLGVVERNDVDVPFRESMAFLIADARRDGGKLALGDSFGVALARRLDSDFVTSDRTELEPLADAGVARFIFIK